MAWRLLGRDGVGRLHSRRVLTFLLSTLMTAGCGSSGATPGPAASAEPSTSPTAMLTCGDRDFPVSGLNAPSGAEKGTGPEFDALRAALATFGSEFPGSGSLTWRLAGRDDTGAVFLTRSDAMGAPRWLAVDVTFANGEWKPTSMGQCDPRVVLSPEFGPATWALDATLPAPAADTTDLHVEVWEVACGPKVAGRISDPLIEYGASTVTITLGVRVPQAEPGQAFTCARPIHGTLFTIHLSEPLGTRTLLDGGRMPPAPPTSDP
jgi:hypothetical protein